MRIFFSASREARVSMEYFVTDAVALAELPAAPEAALLPVLLDAVWLSSRKGVPFMPVGCDGVGRVNLG